MSFPLLFLGVEGEGLRAWAFPGPTALLLGAQITQEGTRVPKHSCKPWEEGQASTKIPRERSYCQYGDAVRSAKRCKQTRHTYMHTLTEGGLHKQINAVTQICTRAHTHMTTFSLSLSLFSPPPLSIYLSIYLSYLHADAETSLTVP